MTLTILSFFILAYGIARFILPLPCHAALKALLGLLFLFISQKFLIYRYAGGLLFAPNLPRWLLLLMETLYAAMLLLIALLFIADIVSVLLWLGRHMGANLRLPVSAPLKNAVLALLALGLGAFGVWQATKVPNARTVEIAVPRLPAELDGFTLAQLSDLHVGPLLKRDWLSAVVRATNALNPDAVVITGDLVDGGPKKIRHELEPLRELKARHGVYGITGNHEYYSNIRQWLPVFKDMGIDMLHNEHRVLSQNGAALVLAGMPDSVERQFGGSGPDLEKTMRHAPNAVRILLAHRPGEAPAHHAAADIQLSGHTHGGHLFFLKPLIARYNNGFVDGLYDVNGMTLYVHPGTGLWNGFSCRIGVPSEITRIVLRAEKNAAGQQ